MAEAVLAEQARADLFVADTGREAAAYVERRRSQADAEADGLIAVALLRRPELVVDNANAYEQGGPS